MTRFLALDPLLKIVLPFPLPPELSPNYRGHWAPKARMVKEVKVITAVLAQQAWREKPPLEKAEARITFVFTDKRRRDIDNFLARAKPVWDGLVAAGVLKDDDSEHLKLLSPEIKKGKEAQTIVEVWGASA